MIKKLVIIPILLAGTVASAESLEERKYWKGQMDYVQRSLDSAEKSCGVQFKFEWVTKEKLRTETAKNNNSPNGIASAIIDEVEGLCREGDDEKSSVKAKIKGFKVGYAKPRTLDLKGGIVIWMGNFEESNFSDWAKPWLTKRL